MPLYGSETVHHHLFELQCHSKSSPSNIWALLTNEQTHLFVRATPVKGKEHHTPSGVLVGCSSPSLRPSARRWINHLNLWHMASTMLRLPFQSKDITVRDWHQIILLGDRGTCVNNLPKDVTWQQLGRELNSRPLNSQPNALTITPPGHTCRL